MRMSVLRRLWMVMAVWAVVCFAQPLSFVITPHDFQHKKTKVKRKNLDYLSGCGLILRDRDQAGEIDSEPVELPIGALMLSFQWVSSLPSNGLIIRAQVSTDGRVWSSWFPASDGIQFNPHSNLYMGKPLSGWVKLNMLDITWMCSQNLLPACRDAWLGSTLPRLLLPCLRSKAAKR
jgi:hypothetical protein